MSKETGNLYALLIQIFDQIILSTGTVEPGTFLPGQLTLFQPEGQIMPTTLLLAPEYFLNVLLSPQIHIILINVDEN